MASFAYILEIKMTCNICKTEMEKIPVGYEIFYRCSRCDGVLYNNKFYSRSEWAAFLVQLGDK
jgi:hypothetical protein